jgi:hypothetical protein
LLLLAAMMMMLLLPCANLAQRWSPMDAGRASNESRRVTEAEELHQRPTRSNRLARSESILLDLRLCHAGGVKRGDDHCRCNG